MHPPYQNILELVQHGIDKNSNFICATKTLEGWDFVKKSYFQEKIKQITLSLYDFNIKKGDKIAIHCDNSADWIMLDLAIMVMGAVTVPIYVTQSPEHTHYILNHANVKILFISHPRLMGIYADFIQNIQHIHIVTLYSDENNITQSLDDFCQKGKILLKNNPDLFNLLKNAVTPDDTATISYTSGTTGTPKGVVLTHKNLIHSVLAPTQKCFFSDNFNPKQDVVLSFLPLTHIFEHCVIYGYIYLSLPVYIISDATLIKQALEQVKPIHFTTVPRLLEKIYKSVHENITSQTGFSGKMARYAVSLIPTYRLNKKQNLWYWFIDKIVFRKIRASFGGKLQGITSGGAALSKDIMSFFNAIGIPTAQGYGLTETTAAITLYDKNNLLLGCAGKPLDNIDMRINHDGEILVSGHHIMQEYYNDPDNTKTVLKNGWFHTGDIGYMDKNGFLFITDRKKELIKLSTGKYIAPAPIEDSLIKYPAIEQALIIGDGEKFCTALIIITPEYYKYSQTDMVKIIQNYVDDVNKSLPSWEKIKRFHISHDPMTIENNELTPTFKKKRRIILANRADILVKLYQD